MKVAVSVLGIAMSAFHFIIVKYTVQAAQFWRDKLIQIENDSDFWYPAKVDTDLELNIIETRQKTRKLIAYLEPNTIYGCWLPFLLTLLWSLTLCWSTIDYLSRIN
ncbi:MAG: hypothetical protein QMD13_09635 [Candidatus Bathyarchaeia archaeon]|nr:hypothetical protein [Candidatus Bathyarchaeia archaeon]